MNSKYKNLFVNKKFSNIYKIRHLGTQILFIRWDFSESSENTDFMGDYDT